VPKIYSLFNSFLTLIKGRRRWGGDGWLRWMDDGGEEDDGGLGSNRKRVEERVRLRG